VNNHKFQHITDNELLDQFYSDTNNEWLGILLERYTLLLFGTCMKYLKNEEAAKDAVQQIFLKAITELKKYKVVYFKSWIYMVTKNHCLMLLRDKTKFVEVEGLLIKEVDEEEKIEALQIDRNINLLEACIGLLNNEQQTCVTLFYLHKKTYNEITTITGFSLMQVKSYIQNGKRNLKLLIEKNQQRIHDQH
jgi:RNA polymerase sigma-70 factor (ECF subfamily)